MSSYIAFELDALNVVSDVAVASGLPAGDVAHGLLKLWAWCFRSKSDEVTAVHLVGFFGKDAGAVLVAFGFLEPLADGYRVKGADRYRRVSDQRQEAGRARARNSVRVGGKFAGAPAGDVAGAPAGAPLVSDQRTTSEPPAADQRATSEKPALTPSTEIRTPNTKEEEAPPQQVKTPRVLQFDVVAPEGDPESWAKEDFWRWAESTRRKAGCQPEKWPSPVALSRWWTEARAAADVAVLKEAFLTYGDDAHWQRQRPALPWAGFASQWNQYLPMGGKRAS